MPYLLYCMVLMLKPSVGLMVDVSSPFMRFTMVVLPALSRPLHGTRRTVDRAACNKAAREQPLLVWAFN